MFLQWVLEGGHGPNAPEELVIYRDRGGTVTGLVYYGAQLVAAADDDAAIDAFAVETRKHRGLRSFVGPKTTIDALWKIVRAWHPAPLVVRDVQPLYVLRSDALRASEPDVEVRPAVTAEAEIIAEQSAAMIQGELGYDPRANRGGFVAAVRRGIALGLWWVWVVDGTLRFQCNLGPRSAATVQVQGVWTPPELRRHGYAYCALAAIARRLLATEATLSLYVNDFNRPAIALYERLGFTQVGTLATYLFP